MQADQEGFLYPVIDQKKCVDCGICDATCPIINKVEKNPEQTKGFILRIKNNNVLFESTSGGGFTALAEYVLHNGGVVYYRHVDGKTTLCKNILQEGSYDSVEDIDSLMKEALKSVNSYVLSAWSHIYRRDFLIENLVNGGKSCMAGFVLKNTLSDNGGVTRGICKMDDQNNLTEVVETKNIVKTATGAEADGVAVDVNSLVSMNMWGLTSDFLDVLEQGFKEFFEKEVPENPLKAEYLIPIFIGELLEQGKMPVKVLRTNDTWYGMTYHEDVAAVKDSFKKMLENGEYKADLFSDL